MKRTMRLTCGVVLTIGVMACGAGEPEPVEPTPGLTAFTGARIIVGNEGAVIEDATLIVRDGRIGAVGPAASTETPADAAVIDVAGKTIMPGLVNAHGHVNNVRGLQADPEFYTEEHVSSQLGLYARYGVTTVFSLGGDGPAGMAVRDRQGADLEHARLYVGGQIVTGPTPEEAREQVNAVADSDADLVKIRVDDNLGSGVKMTPETYQAVIDTAHERGLRVAAHLYYLEDARGLLEAGVDLIAHSIRDLEISDEVVAMMVEQDVCLCPTLMREVSTYVYGERPDWFGDPFFLREADPAVVEALSAPAYQERIRSRSSSAVYKEAPQDGATESEGDVRCRHHDRGRHRHRTGRSLPGLLRAWRARPDGRGGADADAGGRRVDGRRGALHAGRRRARHARGRQVGRLRRDGREPAGRHQQLTNGRVGLDRR